MPTSRREMLGQTGGALAGIAFTGCGLMRAASAQAPARRREVAVNGKRIKTIDIHAHCHIPEALELMDLRENNRLLPTTAPKPWTSRGSMSRR
jgi:hypothetical protein